MQRQVAEYSSISFERTEKQASITTISNEAIMNLAHGHSGYGEIKILQSQHERSLSIVN